LKQKFKLGTIYHKTIMTHGLGESALAERIESWESALPSAIKLAYLPQPGIVRLRLSISGDDELQLKEMVHQHCRQLTELIPELIFGYDDILLEEVVGQQLKQLGKTMSAAESCTGGYLSHLITAIPGSSVYFNGSVVSYSNQAKSDLLQVPQNLINELGAVSRQVVEAMAVGSLNKFNSDCALSVSGIAGPDGGTPEKPVGTVWVALATKDGVRSQLFHFGEHRGRNIRRSALAALNMLRVELQKQLKTKKESCCN